MTSPLLDRRRGILLGAVATVVTAYFVGNAADDARSQAFADTGCMQEGNLYGCPNQMAASKLQGELDNANTLSTTSTVLWVSAGVLAAGAVVVYIYAPKDRWIVTPTVSSTTATLTLVGQF